MVEASWLLFCAAGVAVILTPGQDMLLVMSRSITQGAAAGVVTAAGVCSGLLLHTILAVLGIGAIVQTSAALFFFMKIAGAAYLLYLGVGLLQTRSADVQTVSNGSRSHGRLYLDGVISNVVNPKIALFYFVFLPQFVLVGASHPTLTVAALGAAYAFMAFLIKGSVGLTAGRLSRWFREKPVYLLIMFRVSGVVLISLGVKLAIQQMAG